VSEGTDVVGRVCRLAAALVVLATGASWALGGHAEAAGALAGGVLTIANFYVLGWLAGKTSPETRPPGAAWVVLGCLRYGVLAVAFGTALVAGGVGLLGLLASLVIVPAAVVAGGLSAAGAS
jgi:hypothetical protein